MPVRFTFDDLWTYESGDSQVRVPLDRLAGDSAHIHGRLSIEIQGKLLPRMGYWGPDDVCFGEWICELQAMLETLSESADARHLYDEGEEGQPAFSFERRGDVVEVSVVDSRVGGGTGVPEWGIRVCRLTDLVRAVEEFLAEFRVEVCRSAPNGEAWWQALAQR